MKNLLVFFILVSSILSAKCQIDTASVSLVAYWYVGDVYNYEVTKIKKSWKQDVLEKSDSTTYYARFEVIDSTDVGYKVKWSYIPDEIVSQFGDEVHSELEEEITPIDLIYTTTELGEIIELVNWKDVSDQTLDLLKLTQTYIDGENEEFAKALKPLQKIYETNEGIETYAMKELNVLHFLYGLEYQTDKPIEYEDEFPNMFGGQPIRADSEIEFTAVDTSDYYFVAEQRSKLNPEDTKEMVTDVLKKMTGRKKGKEFKKFVTDAIFEVTDNNVYEYYYYPGVANYIKTERKTNVVLGDENNRREESIEIILYFDEGDDEKSGN